MGVNFGEYLKQQEEKSILEFQERTREIEERNLEWTQTRAALVSQFAIPREFVGETVEEARKRVYEEEMRSHGYHQTWTR